MRDDVFALLWSKKANRLHVERLTDSADAGKRFFHRDQANDYLLMGFGSLEQVEGMAEAARPIIEERDQVRRLYSAD